jgi:hypothetical protein
MCSLVRVEWVVWWQLSRASDEFLMLDNENVVAVVGDAVEAIA